MGLNYVFLIISGQQMDNNISMAQRSKPYQVVDNSH